MNARPTDGHSTDGQNKNQQAQERAVYRPMVDILDTAGDVVLLADLPGVDESHLDLTLDKNVLTIRGAVQQPSLEGYMPVRMEYGIGDFERVFTISDDVDRDRIEATVKDGVLQLTLPKTAHSARRKINVVAR